LYVARANPETFILHEGNIHSNTQNED